MSSAESALRPDDAPAPPPRPRPAGAWASLLWTGALALLILVVVDVALTRSSLLRADLSIEHSLSFRYVGAVQALQMVRRLAAPPDDGSASVVLLGDSRIWFAARAPALERELVEVLPGRRVRIENLGMFGSRIGDLEAFSRYLDRLHPALVVAALGGEELVRDERGHLATLAARILDVGWRDGPLPPAETDGRLDRWLRTVWPLYRLRALVRLALVDRLLPERPPTPAFLDSMNSQKDLFVWAFGERAPQVIEAYQVWRRSGRLDDFVEYLRVEQVQLRDVGPPAPAQPVEEAAARTLDVLLGRLADGPWASRVLLLPQNPVLDQDTAGIFRPAGLADETAVLIQTTAARRGVTVVDGRRWVPAGGFFDFAHVFPNYRDFQEPLAKELASALREPPRGPRG